MRESSWSLLVLSLESKDGALEKERHLVWEQLFQIEAKRRS